MESGQNSAFFKIRMGWVSLDILMRFIPNLSYFLEPGTEINVCKPTKKCRRTAEAESA